MAQSGHRKCSSECLLLGEKRTPKIRCLRSACDPYATSGDSPSIARLSVFKGGYAVKTVCYARLCRRDRVMQARGTAENHRVISRQPSRRQGEMLRFHRSVMWPIHGTDLISACCAGFIPRRED